MRMIRQLGREDWVAAGLEVLLRKGWRELRVEPVARGLAVSKGSFYWHFRDRAAWCAAILGLVEHRVFSRLARALPPETALWARLADWAAHDLAAARIWAAILREDPGSALQAVRRVA